MYRPSRLLLSVLLVILSIAAIGLITAAVISRRIDRTQRDLLLVQTKHAALLVSPQDIASLSASDADLSNPLYQRLKSQLTAFREANSDIRFVYIMGYRPELRTQFFYVDSEPVTSADYSPPGQLFPDTRPQDIERYLAGKPYTDGPYRDSWGQWVSGYVPVVGQSGTTVYMIGIDVSTDVWHEQVVFVRTMVAIIAMLLVLIGVYVTVRLHRKERSIESLSLKNQKLQKSESSMRQLQDMAHLGSFAIYFPQRSIKLGEQMSALIGGTPGENISFESILGTIHTDDREKFTTMVQEIETGGIVYTWVDIRIGSSGAGYRSYHIYGNVIRHAGGAPERFEGIIQDITDIKK